MEILLNHCWTMVKNGGKKMFSTVFEKLSTIAKKASQILLRFCARN
jgi:2-polyprenyl-3-methyl-5-hydroxy-6-metoxy-1,4-benzoquinol methylase